MRIGLHLESLRVGQIGGLETYVRQLVRWLPELSDDVTLVLFCADYNVRSFAPGPRVEVRTLDQSRFAALDATGLKNARLDLWFCPLLVLEPHEPGLPSAVTIPDIQHETFPRFFTPTLLEWRRRHYTRSARRADAILTLSAHSRDHIVETMGVDAGKVHAIHLDAIPHFDDAAIEDAGYLHGVKVRHGLPDGFLFYPANNWPHKNHATLFAARRLAQATLGRPLPLVLTGAEVDGVDPWQRVISATDRADGVRYLGYVPDADLPGLYALSIALVFPSLFEGFGMPVLEAMRAGCPVVCSHAPSLREIAGNAALYFNPMRPEELAARIVESVAGRSDLVAAGRVRAGNFSWERTARETLDVFHALVASEGVTKVTAAQPDERLPLISVVTPSFQQGQFIEETLRSVLEQQYPRLEYWVIDGGSTDGTLEVLERYHRRYPDVLRYMSEPDGGQAAAVNKGLNRVRGDIIGWLNSDDTYEPGTLAAVARAFRDHRASDVVYGRAHHVSRTGRIIGEYPTQPAFRWDALIHECYLCQPSVFMRRGIIDDGYRLDESLHLCLDYDLWIRLGQHYRFSFIDRHLSRSRVYRENKSLRQQGRVLQEALDVIWRHYGWVPLSWATAWAHFRRKGADAFFNIRPVSKGTYLAAVWLLVRYNWSAPRHWRRVLHDVTAALARSWRKRWTGVWPSARRTLTIPRGALIVECGVESNGHTTDGDNRVDVACDGRRLAAVAVNGPGRYTRRVGVPRRRRGLATRLTIASDLLRSGAARALPLEPFPAVAADGWLEREDTLRIPSEWSAVEITFMLPVVPAEGVQLEFRHRGQVVDTWAYNHAGDHRRQLRLPADGASASGIVDLDFSASAALPPAPARGETRALAMRIVELGETPDPRADG